jgi:hypothetical protein
MSWYVNIATVANLAVTHSESHATSSTFTKMKNDVTAAIAVTNAPGG